MQLLDLFRPLTDFGLTNRQETDDSHWWWCREIKCIELSILGKNQLIQYYYYYYYFAHLVACTCFSLTVTNAAAWQDVYCALLHPPRLPTVSWQSQVDYDHDHRIIGITNNAVFVSSSGSVVIVFCAETQRATDRDFENATTTVENHCIHIIIAHIQIGEQQLVNEFLHFCCTLFRDAWRDKTAGAWYFVFSKWATWCGTRAWRKAMNHFLH